MRVAYERTLESLLRENALILFGLGGEERTLDCERHIDGRHRGVRLSRHTRLQLALDMWASFEVHLLRSNYRSSYWGCVHVELKWLRTGRGAPPCIILKSGPSPHFSKSMTVEKTPRVEWRGGKVLGQLLVEYLKLEEAGDCIRFRLARDQTEKRRAKATNSRRGRSAS
jgi:hypothetical protein